ncbi:MAG: hypothetical protein ACM32E_09470 [Gemmatimonadota bacterium]
MHPEFARRLADQRRAELLAARRGSRSREGGSWPGAAGRWLGRAWPRRRFAGAARVPQPAPPTGVFLDGTEAYGFRIYLTPAEARRLARDCSRLAGRYADRVDDPRRRPAGAMPVEVVVLSRRLPEPAGAGRGLPGPGSC